MDYGKAYKEALEIAHKINVERSEQTKEKIIDWLEKKKSIDVLDKEEREFAENVDAFRKEIDAAYQRGYEEGKRQSKCKFSVGDVVKHSLYDGLYYIVKSIDLAGDYELECLNGKSGNNIASATEEYLSLWTIKDAKPGDVLTDGDIFVIFKSNSYDPKTQYGCMFVYCSMRKYNGGWHEFWYESGGLNPTGYLLANKEQRRYFFKRMEDAGYEWNIGRLELRKKTKQEWSEEDENIMQSIIGILTKQGFQTQVNWLKSLRPQNNITDEELIKARNEAYNDALDKLEYHSDTPTFNDGWSAAIWYLKKRNTQPQSTWKPSDEQIRALNYYLKNDIDNDGVFGSQLVKLYQDLKKLMEE